MLRRMSVNEGNEKRAIVRFTKNGPKTSWIVRLFEIICHHHETKEGLEKNHWTTLFNHAWLWLYFPICFW